MTEPKEESAKTHSDGKALWEPPAIRVVGTVSLLVRAGSAVGKMPGDFDGDASQFQGRNPP